MNNNDWNLSSNSAFSMDFITTSSSVYASLIAICWQIYNISGAYYLPVVIFLATINNTICLLVFNLSREFKTKTSRNARFYYIAFSAASLCKCLIRGFK